MRRIPDKRKRLRLLIFPVLFILLFSLLRPHRITTVENFLTSPPKEKEELFIIPRLQQKTEALLRKANPIVGVCIVGEVKTGKILTLAVWGRDSLPTRAHITPYPSASIFKIITATCALEYNLLSPSATIPFCGRHHSRNPSTWLCPHPPHSATFEEGLALSSNPVIGIVGACICKQKRMLKTAKRFFFQTQGGKQKGYWGWVDPPEKLEELASLSSGLTGSTLSPMHAFCIIQAIANNGTMILPRINPKERTKKRRVCNPKTAKTLRRMLEKVVSKGTAHSGFYNKKGKYLLGKVRAGGKTGTLYRREAPKGIYDWFCGFAPVEDPEVCICVFLINPFKWNMRASYLACNVLRLALPIMQKYSKSQQIPRKQETSGLR